MPGAKGKGNPKSKKGGRGKKGGNSGGGGGFNIRTRLANPNEKAEMYAKVTKMYGQGVCEVLCNDNKSRQCIIRNKFRGRNRKSNMVEPNTLVLVGLRDWEVIRQDKMEKCDLLEVYNAKQYKDIKQDPMSNWNVISVDKSAPGEGTSEDSHTGTPNAHEDEDLFDFIVDGEEESETITEQKNKHVMKARKERELEQQNAIQDVKNFLDDDDIDIDDI